MLSTITNIIPHTQFYSTKNTNATATLHKSAALHNKQQFIRHRYQLFTQVTRIIRTPVTFLLSYTDPWIIPRENVQIQPGKLGSGSFADVFIGKLTGDAAIKRVYDNHVALDHFHDCEVAVKMLRSPTTEESRSEFQQVG